MVKYENTEDRILRYAKKLVSRKFSYFVKFDEVSGVSACPGCKYIPNLEMSCYDNAYKKQFASRLKRIEPGDNPLRIE